MDLEIQLRIAPVHQPEHRRQQIRRHGRDHAEPEDPGEGGPYRLGLVQQRADRVQYGPRPDREPFTGRGEHHLARRTLHELYAEHLFQRRDGPGKCGLAHPDRGCRVPEMQLLGDGREGTQLGQTGLFTPLTGVFDVTHGHH